MRVGGIFHQSVHLGSGRPTAVPRDLQPRKVISLEDLASCIALGSDPVVELPVGLSSDFFLLFNLHGPSFKYPGSFASPRYSRTLGISIAASYPVNSRRRS